MSAPLVDPTDLGVYLNDVESIDDTRAAMMIADAQALCESIVSPLPAAAALVVKRVAARGYVSTTAARQYQLNEADAAYGTVAGPVGGVYLTQSDVLDLRRLGGVSGGAFSIDLLPVDYVAPVPWGSCDLGWYP